MYRTVIWRRSCGFAASGDSTTLLNFFLKLRLLHGVHRVHGGTADESAAAPGPHANRYRICRHVKGQPPTQLLARVVASIVDACRQPVGRYTKIERVEFYSRFACVPVHAHVEHDV